MTSIRNLCRLVVVLALAQTSAFAQGITIPNTFTNNTVADADQVNANFAALAANALNRNAGTLGGTLNLNGQTLSGAATASGAWTFSSTVAHNGVVTMGANLLFSADNTQDIGASGATRPRDFFLGRNAAIGGTLGVTGATTLAALSATTGAFSGALTGVAATFTNSGNALTFNSGGAAAGIIATGHNLLVRSNFDVVVQVDVDNNGSNIFAIQGGTGGNLFTVDETGQVNTTSALIGEATNWEITHSGTGYTRLRSNGITYLDLDDNANDANACLHTRNGTDGDVLKVCEDGTTTLTDLQLNGSSIQTGSAEVQGIAPASPDKETIYADSMVKAWASVANNGSATLTDDYNVASVTRNGVGDVTVTFATALASANYACSVTPEGGTFPHANVMSKATGSVRARTYDANFGTAADANFNVICVGE